MKPSATLRTRLRATEALPRALGLVGLALLARVCASLPSPAARVVRVVCGAAMMVTPLALWVAWTPAVFLAVLGTGTSALFVYLALVHYGPDDGAL